MQEYHGIVGKYKNEFQLNENVYYQCKNGSSTFFGLLMAQNQNALMAYSTLLNHLSNNNQKIGRIIEIGCANGGLSILFKLFSMSYGCDFMTYDIFNSTIHKDIFKSLNVDFRLINCFDENAKIKEEIEKEGITILLCDGGNKVREFEVFSKYLKPNDIILVHDYIDYNQQEPHKYWCCEESNNIQLQKSITENNIIPFMYMDFLKAATFCGMKQ